MDRQFAISQLARLDLNKLTPEERAEELDTMQCERWDEDPRWHTIPLDIRNEFEAGELTYPPSDPRYDGVLLLSLSRRYVLATNSFLLKRLQEDGIEVDAVVGEPVQLEACPCCGYRTIGSRGAYQICRVCWWEDDGQDDGNADVVMGGPNRHLSLTQGRINFLKEGLANPQREDLRRHQDPPNMYARGRVFVLSSDGDGVDEVGAP